MRKGIDLFFCALNSKCIQVRIVFTVPLDLIRKKNLLCCYCLCCALQIFEHTCSSSPLFFICRATKARIVHTSDECNVRWKKFRKASHLKRLNVIIIQRFRDSLWRDVEIKLIKKRTIKIHHHKTVKFIMNNLTWWIHRRFGCFSYSHYFQLSMTGSDEKNMHSL